ncbi:MAG: hypothetical protein OEU36_17510 [Gammaproteobacteria bacterium]|nr:hypothetical protein [Gammaproteobacteria bacterium]
MPRYWGKALAMQPQFHSYRVCPRCEARFAVDPSTKRKQAIAMVLALVSLYVTIRLMIDGANWLVLACLSYGVLAAYIYFANSRVVVVPYVE